MLEGSLPVLFPGEKRNKVWSIQGPFPQVQSQSLEYISFSPTLSLLIGHSSLFKFIFLNYKCQFWSSLLWCSGLRIHLQQLRSLQSYRFHAQMFHAVQRVKHLALQQLQSGSQLQLRLDPKPRTSMCYGCGHKKNLTR